MSHCNLIVNYLPSDADEAEISKLFSEYGVVESVKIVRNKDTGTSMCYGFVVMAELQQGENAIKGLNQKSLRGKLLRVNIAKPRHSGGLREEANTNLYVSGLPSEIDEGQLESVFGKYGVIMSCRVLRNSQGASRRIAFVKFVDHADADRAVRDISERRICLSGCEPGVCTCTNVVTAKFALPSNKNISGNGPGSGGPMHRRPSYTPGGISSTGYPSSYHVPPAAAAVAAAAAYQNAYMGVYPHQSYAYQNAVQHQQHYPYQVQPVHTTPLPVSHMANYYSNGLNTNGYSYPYPSVLSSTTSLSAAAQISAMAFSTYTGATTQSSGGGLSVTASNLAQISSGNHCVFVYGLTQNATEQELQALFYPFGAISNCRLCYESSNGKRVCKGYGFVNFYSYNDALQAINSLNNFVYNGHTLQVRFKSIKEGS